MPSSIARVSSENLQAYIKIADTIAPINRTICGAEVKKRLASDNKNFLVSSLSINLLLVWLFTFLITLLCETTTTNCVFNYLKLIRTVCNIRHLASRIKRNA